MDTQREPTPQEIEATVAKAQAEAQRALNEATKFANEAAYAAALARQADAVATEAELKIAAFRAQDQERLAGDEYNLVYRFNGRVDSESVNKCVRKLVAWDRQYPEDRELQVIFSSGGGEIIKGFELFDTIRAIGQRRPVVTGCTGMAASMAGILVQAGTHRWMSKESWYMIHRAAFGIVGKTYEVEDEVNWIKRIEERIIQIFVDRSNLTAAKIRRNWDRKEWWIASNEASEMGLVDEIRG